MNILAEMVETQLGLEEWNGVLDEAGETGIYTSTALYDDALSQTGGNNKH